MTFNLNLGDLGPGWEQTERALADLQADLSRTVPDAPTVILLWREVDEDDEDDDWSDLNEPDERWAYVGKAADWYFGANGGFALPRDYASAVSAIADQLSDAIIDALLGYLAYWPHCPVDDHLLGAQVDAAKRCWWVCPHGEHTVAGVGHLRAPAENR